MVSAAFSTDERDGKALMGAFCGSRLLVGQDEFVGTPLDGSGFGGWIFALSGER